MTERVRHSSRHKGMVVSLNLRATPITVRVPVTRQYHKLQVPGARLAPPLTLDSRLLSLYSTFPLEAKHLLSMTVIPAQEGLCYAACCRPPPVWALRFSPCVYPSC